MMASSDSLSLPSSCFVQKGEKMIKLKLDDPNNDRGDYEIVWLADSAGFGSSSHTWFEHEPNEVK
jgi:hypothetical protein